jgi:hypothetical protein
MRCLPLPVQSDDHCQADGDFCSRNGDSEKDKHLPIEIVIETGKSHESQISGIQHQLEGHIDHEQVAPDNHAEQANAKQQNAYS